MRCFCDPHPLYKVDGALRSVSAQCGNLLLFVSADMCSADAVITFEGRSILHPRGQQQYNIQTQRNSTTLLVKSHTCCNSVSSMGCELGPVAWFAPCTNCGCEHTINV